MSAVPLRIQKAEPTPTGDETIDQLQASLGRPLSPNELFNVQQGLPHDHVPPPQPPTFDPENTRPDEHVEDALRRRAQAQKADGA